MSTTSVLEPASARPSRAVGVVLVLALLAAILFVAVAALPYLSFLVSDDTARGALDAGRFDAYSPRRAWLLVHIAGGLVAILSGPVQLWLGISDRRMDLHRKLGLVYIGGVTVGTIGAIGLALQSPFGWIFASGLLGLALAWVVATSLAFASIRRSLVQQHKEWMVRSYVVTFAFVTFRVLDVALIGAGMPLQQVFDFAAWSCWAVPLVVTEAVIQGKKIFAVAA
jgi:hypothetical protein